MQVDSAPRRCMGAERSTSHRLGLAHALHKIFPFGNLAIPEGPMALRPTLADGLLLSRNPQTCEEARGYLEFQIPGIPKLGFVLHAVKQKSGKGFKSLTFAMIRRTFNNGQAGGIQDGCDFVNIHSTRGIRWTPFFRENPPQFTGSELRRESHSLAADRIPSIKDFQWN